LRNLEVGKPQFLKSALKSVTPLKFDLFFFVRALRYAFGKIAGQEWCGISIAGAHTARSVSARHAQSSYQSPKRTMGRSLGSPCLAACITSIIWRHDASDRVFAPYRRWGFGQDERRGDDDRVQAPRVCCYRESRTVGLNGKAPACQATSGPARDRLAAF
jgi:hypothetical protein